MQQAKAIAPTILWNQVTVIWTDDEGIRAQNKEWFGNDTVTDVISFMYDAFPGEDGIEGELLVNVHQAWVEGALRKGPMQEMALYLAHGCDHLHGANDDTEERKTRMLVREKSWVKQALDAGILQDLYEPATTA